MIQLVIQGEIRPVLQAAPPVDRAAARALIIENTGTPMDFESPFWAGQRPVETTGFDERPYPLPFHPLELAEETLRGLFGFNYEGLYHDDDPDLENIVLSGFTVHPVH